MMQKLSGLFYGFLKIVAGSQRLGLGMIRVAILIIFVWIGGLKFWNYEAEGIVPFVANSPFMSFFYNEKAPEYRQYKLPEGSFDAAKHEWHVKNNTYGFSHGLGLLIMSIGLLTFFGFFSRRVGLVGELLAIVMTLGTLSFLATTPEVWVPEHRPAIARAAESIMQIPPELRRDLRLSRNRPSLLLPEVNPHRVSVMRKSPFSKGDSGGLSAPDFSGPPAVLPCDSVRTPTSAGSKSASGLPKNPSGRVCCFRGSGGKAP